MHRDQTRIIVALSIISLLVAVCHGQTELDIGLPPLDHSGTFGEDPADAIESDSISRHLLNDAGGDNASLRPPAWYGRFDPVYKRTYIAPAVAQNTCKSEGRNCSAIDDLSYPYEQYIMDPTEHNGPASPVMKVHYPRGSWSAGSLFPGGTLFYAYPFKYHPSYDKDNQLSRVSSTLEYEVYFPEDFPFNKGGKLPGFSGGGKDNGRGCGGGVDPDECFSFRMMWRKNGAGEAYLYVPEGKQAEDFCTFFPPCITNADGCNVCNYKAGVSFGRGSFHFQRGAWNKVTMTMRLNTPTEKNGMLRVKFNDEEVIRYDKMNWRELENVFVEGVEFSTWFGGSDETWGPPYDTNVMFKNVRAWRGDPPAQPTASTKSLAMMTGLTGQVVEEVEMTNIAN